MCIRHIENPHIPISKRWLSSQIFDNIFTTSSEHIHCITSFSETAIVLPKNTSKCICRTPAISQMEFFVTLVKVFQLSYCHKVLHCRCCSSSRSTSEFYLLPVLSLAISIPQSSILFIKHICCAIYHLIIPGNRNLERN